MTPSVPAVVVHAGRLLLLGGTTQAAATREVAGVATGSGSIWLV